MGRYTKAVLRDQERIERRAGKRLTNKRLKPREAPGWPDNTKRQKRLRFQDKIGMVRPK